MSTVSPRRIWHYHAAAKLLSHFSHVRLCATPEMAAHQPPPSLGFSRQEHWSGLPFPSPMHESEKWKWSCSVVSRICTARPVAYQNCVSVSAQLRPTLCDPMDYSPPDSSVHGVLQARTLEWVAIPFSRVSFWPRDLTQGSHPALQADSLPSEPPGKPIGIHDICVSC